MDTSQIIQLQVQDRWSELAQLLGAFAGEPSNLHPALRWAAQDKNHEDEGRAGQGPCSQAGLMEEGQTMQMKMEKNPHFLPFNQTKHEFTCGLERAKIYYEGPDIHSLSWVSKIWNTVACSIAVYGYS